MTLFPPPQLGWLNGWVPMVFFYGLFFILLKIFPNKTVDRLYDRTVWTDGQAAAAKVGLPFALIVMILIVFTPLGELATSGLYKISRNPQWVTFIQSMIGLSLMVASWTIRWSGLS